jgi:uncharacterized repeat protein (TIGR01451 family)
MVANMIFRNWVKITIIFLIYFNLLPCMSIAIEITSDFECNNANASTTYYTYLKQAGLDESGYTRGLKTGSFDYFNGERAVLKDHLEYYDGKVDANHPSDSLDHNATVKHNLDVDFSGDRDSSKGISTYYAEGFYTDNRAVSAHKKVWDANETWPSNEIGVTAKTFMSMAGTYDFKYSVDASNAYFVFSDSSGLSNKTGARRIDWEQSGLMRGEKINVTNDLYASGGYTPRAGEGDWLPCLQCPGNIPPFEPIDGVWPSSQALAMLTPAPSIATPGKCSPYGCSNCKNNCLSWAGICQLAGTITPSGEVTNVPQIPPVSIESYFVKKDDIAEYTINVRNQGTIDLKGVRLYDTLPEKAIFIDGSARLNDGPVVTDSAGKGIKSWYLDTIQAFAGDAGMKTITFRLNTSESGTSSDSIYAVYQIGNGPQQKTDPPVSSTPIEHTPEGI